MDISELFLISWATLATGLAVYYRSNHAKLDFECAMFRTALHMIASGRAKASLKGDKVYIEGVEDGINS